MNSFTEKFNSATDNKYLYIRIFSVKVSASGSKVAVTLLCDKKFAESYKKNKNDILSAIKSLLPPETYPEWEERLVGGSAAEVINAIYEYLRLNNVFLMYAIEKDMITITTGDSVSVRCVLPLSVYTYFVRGNFGQKLTEYLNQCFFSPCIVSADKYSESAAEIKTALDVKVQTPKFSYERPDEGRVIKPSQREKLIGEVITDDAVYICDCVQPTNYSVVCGSIGEYKAREYTSKDGKQKKFATFTLNDDTGSLRCSFFPRAGDESKLERLTGGEYIIAGGRLQYDDFLSDGSVKLTVNRISFAARPENFEVNNIVRLPGDDYVYVKPQKVQFAQQYSLAQEDNFSCVAAPLVLFEIFTAATTGKSGVPLEIGAVKIIGGRVTQTFHSLIKPDVRLPEKLARALGINETDYIRCPSYDQVFPDFYLFTQGCDITAYPSAENFSALSAAYRKLHIPPSRLVDISAFIPDPGELRQAKPSGEKTALSLASAYAEKLIT